MNAGAGSLLVVVEDLVNHLLPSHPGARSKNAVCQKKDGVGFQVDRHGEGPTPVGAKNQRRFAHRSDGPGNVLRTAAQECSLGKAGFTTCQMVESRAGQMSRVGEPFSIPAFAPETAGFPVRHHICHVPVNQCGLSRHLAGAFLMGTGGVFALGCTIGQGVSAASLMALSTPLTMIGIMFGARIGLGYLIEGAPFGFLRQIGSQRIPREPAE